jgi:hypothetical protein
MLIRESYRHSCQRYLWLQKQGKSVNGGDQPTMVSRKRAGSRTLMMSVAYFWPDFVEPYSFSVEFIAPPLLVLSLLDNTVYDR